MFFLIIFKFTSNSSAVLWLLFFFIITGTRVIELYLIKPKIKTIKNFDQLRIINIIDSTLLGFTYGAGILFFMPLMPLLAQICILCVMLAGIPATLISLASDKYSFYAYFSPLILSIIIFNLLQFDRAHSIIFLLSIIYLFVMMKLYLWLNERLRNAINLQLLNNRLIEKLKKSNSTLERLSEIDSLTKIANRRQYDLILNKEWNRARRNITTISLMMIDVDFFKQYNDIYGHIEGDKCLILIAKTLQQCVKRTSDLVARVGGEEFAIILPDTNNKESMLLADIIHNSIKELKISHEKSSVSQFITISIGIATAIPNDEQKNESIMLAADRALYIAKERGRNNTFFQKEI